MPRNKNQTKRRIKFWFLIHLGSPLLALVLHLLRLTVRHRVIHVERLDQALREHGRLIFAFWHGAQISITMENYRQARRNPIYVLVSPSRDGELLVRVIRWFRARAVRGSSASRSISGFRELLAVLKDKGSAAIAVDGPRGPYHDIKPGIFLLAKQSGVPILPVKVRFSNAWTTRTWDRTRIPKPFSRVDFEFQPLIILDQGSDKADFEAARDRLEMFLETS